MDRDDSKDEMKEKIDNENVEHIFQRIDYTVKHGFQFWDSLFKFRIYLAKFVLDIYFRCQHLHYHYPHSHPHHDKKQEWSVLMASLHVSNHSGAALTVTVH